MRRLLRLLLIIKNSVLRKSKFQEYVILVNEPDDVHEPGSSGNNIAMTDLEARRNILRSQPRRTKVDNTDKVPCIQRPDGGFTLLSEDSDEAKEIMANPDDHYGANAGRFHRSLPWVFYGLTDNEAARLLRSFQRNGSEPGLFLIGFYLGKPNLYYIAGDGKVGVGRIFFEFDQNKVPWYGFRFGQYFRNFQNLIEHYQRFPADCLSVKLGNAVHVQIEPEFLSV